MVATPHDAFVNVDLEIAARTRTALMPLIERLDGTLFEMYVGRIRGLYHAHYESLGPSSIRGRNRRAHTPTSVIHELADVIERLDVAGRRAWNAAVTRDFNVGIDVARGVWMTECAVAAAAIQRVAALGGRIVFTAYQEAASRRPATRPTKRKGKRARH